MSRTTLLICVATLLIVAGLALGTRSGTSTTPVHSPSTPAEDGARAIRGGIPSTAHPDTPRESLSQEPRHAPDVGTVETATDTLATAASTTNVATPRTGARAAMPWMERDEREVAEEIASNAVRTDGPPALPSTSFAQIEQLYELVPELAEGTANSAVDLAELVDDPGLGPLAPGTASKPGAYFEPPEDEED